MMHPCWRRFEPPMFGADPFDQPRGVAKRSQESGSQGGGGGYADTPAAAQLINRIAAGRSRASGETAPSRTGRKSNRAGASTIEIVSEGGGWNISVTIRMRMDAGDLAVASSARARSRGRGFAAHRDARLSRRSAALDSRSPSSARVEAARRRARLEVEVVARRKDATLPLR